MASEGPVYSATLEMDSGSNGCKEILFFFFFFFLKCGLWLVDLCNLPMIQACITKLPTSILIAPFSLCSAVAKQLHYTTWHHIQATRAAARKC